jgi:rSAM/selenodomain-associated transferase 2
MKLSIIIPTLNEEGALDRTLGSIAGDAHELILVDGGSTDDTVEIARQFTRNILDSRRGRGIQQHTGACHAQGDVLLFLHADTILPEGFHTRVRKALSDPGVAFGAFRLAFFPSSMPLRFIALMANLRSRFLKVPYGDQALFMRKSAYFKAGGFSDLPIMEDVDIVRRLKRIGGFKIIRDKAKTSARRWEKEGTVYATVRNNFLMIRYLLGASPHRLSRLYSDNR